ncbi:MAG: DUF1905 domain-containing protein [Cyclobacteriaceae bacterium]|nr:DUF1905 domain-containing protein [Cyclobacteriaceae bacterium]
MVRFTTKILRFGKMGEKTGWTYIRISASQAQKLNPGKKTGYRVKGTLDQHPIQRVALLPMGEGAFIIPLNAKMRKAIGKGQGDSLTVSLEVDQRTIPPSADFMKCLKDDARAISHFRTLSGSHQRYFSKWIEEAKTVETKTKRITMAVIALGSGQGFPEMIRANKARKH